MTPASDLPPLAEQVRAICAAATTDFAAAVAKLTAVLAQATPSARNAACVEYIAGRAAAADYAAIAQALYALAEAQTPAFAAVLGRWAVARGVDDDGVLVALADILNRCEGPQSSAQLLEAMVNPRRSAHFIAKLADFWRDRGLLFQAELMLREAVESGRADLRLRLAEHFFEFRDWRAAHETLRRGEATARSAYENYLLGRCCVALLLGPELAGIIAALEASAEASAAAHGALLRNLWIWRVGQDAGAARQVAAALHPTAARDNAELPAGPAPPSAALPAPALWRAGSGGKRAPNVLGIGMQRTATTWLDYQLGQHPAVHKPNFKEASYFNDFFSLKEAWGHQVDLNHLNQREIGYWQGPTRNLHAYLSLYDSDKPVRLDITPAYGELPEATVAAIAAVAGRDTRIILSLRDPVERAWSNLKYDLRLAGMNLAAFADQQRLAHYLTVASRRRGDYAAVLQVWRRHFDRIHIVWYEQVAAAPQAALTALFSFVELEPLAAPDLAGPINASFEAAMPAADRAFLVNLYRPSYDQLETLLGEPVARWRAHQQRSLGG